MGSKHSECNHQDKCQCTSHPSCGWCDESKECVPLAPATGGKAEQPVCACSSGFLHSPPTQCLLPKAPGKPEALEVGVNTVELSWSIPSAPGYTTPALSEYQIHQYNPDSMVFEFKQSVNATEDQALPTTYSIQGLQSDSDYLFQVVAVNSAGAGAPSMPSEVIHTLQGADIGLLVWLWVVAVVFFGVAPFLLLSIVDLRSHPANSRGPMHGAGSKRGQYDRVQLMEAASASSSSSNLDALSAGIQLQVSCVLEQGEQPVWYSTPLFWRRALRPLLLWLSLLLVSLIVVATTASGFGDNSLITLYLVLVILTAFMNLLRFYIIKNQIFIITDRRVLSITPTCGSLMTQDGTGRVTSRTFTEVNVNLIVTENADGSGNIWYASDLKGRAVGFRSVRAVLFVQTLIQDRTPQIAVPTVPVAMPANTTTIPAQAAPAQAMPVRQQ